MFCLKLNTYGNYRSLEVVGRGNETHTSGENLNYLIERFEGEVVIGNAHTYLFRFLATISYPMHENIN